MDGSPDTGKGTPNADKLRDSLEPFAITHN